MLALNTRVGFVCPRFRPGFRALCALFLTLLISLGVIAGAHWYLDVACARHSQPREARFGQSRLSESVSIRAAGRGNPTVNLSDGHDVLTSYLGSAELRVALEQNQAEPLSLASADFDEDGVPDLISGYSYKGQGIVTLLRGNVDSIYPNAPEAKQRKANGTFTDAPFLSPARAFDSPVAADFIGAGDFDADGHWDIVAAQRDGESLMFLAGDGRGGFALPQQIALSGKITAFTTGEVNRRDGLTDVVVGLTDEESESSVLVFEGPEGALKAEPEVFALPARATSLALGFLDEHYAADLAIAAGRDLIIIEGRDRKLSLNESQRAKVAPPRLRRHHFESTIKSVAVGNFIGGDETDLALLTDDGAVRLLSQTKAEGGKNSSSRRLEERGRLADFSGPSEAVQLISAHVSSSPQDDLLILDETNRQLRIVTNGETGAPAIGTPAPPRVLASWEVEHAPAAVLPMRLNGDALNDLVLLRSGASAPAVLETQPLATFVVTNTADSGAGSLRQAILDANVNAGADTITFNIPGAGVKTISPSIQLPEITDPVTVDGYTQPGASPNTLANGDNAVLLIELNGASSRDSNGLVIRSGGSTVRGLVTNRFRGAGIGTITGGGNVIEGNFIGTNPAGTVDLDDNHNVGVNIDSPNNLIGGTTPGARNVISGHGAQGVRIFGGEAAGNRLQGNFIGTDSTGAVSLSNKEMAVFIGGAPNTVIGGTTAGARNIISGNDSRNILIEGSAGNIVQGNYIGTDVTGAVDISISGSGVHIAQMRTLETAIGSSNNLIGGTTPGARNVISGNNGIGIYLELSTGNMVQGNFIGIDVTGAVALPNTNGVRIDGGSSNTVGGATAGARNVISGNHGKGVEISFGSTGNTVEGNFIGTNSSGTAAVGNGLGVFIYEGSNHVIGGTTVQSRNIISGNRQGIVLINSTDNRVQGNYIGTDVTGTIALSNNNGTDAIFLSNSSRNTIGGTTAGARNVISGGGGSGIALYGGPSGFGPGESRGNKIQGNFIGTNAAGSARLGNAGDGIQITITNSAADNEIGGAMPETRNIVSGNNGNGIAIGIRLRDPVTDQLLPGTGGTGITVQNNYIGTDVTGQTCIGNTLDGIFVDADSAINTIRDNLVTCNGRNGVFIPQNSNPGVRIFMDNNSVFGNNALGIDLGVAGITANDLLDTDAGANLQQNFPVLTSFAANAVSESETFKSGATLGGIDLPGGEGISVAAVNVNGTLNSAPNTTFTVHWYFSGDSQCVTNQATSRPLASGKIPGVTTDGSGNAPFIIPLQFPAGINTGIVNCTATDPNGNTSEFSACLPVTSPPRTLTVASTNPASGVNITVTPGDNNTQANGATQFTRAYYSGSVVTLTAPAIASGNNFQKWQRDGVDAAVTQSTNVTMDANHTMIAIYVSPTWEPVVLTGQQIAEMKAWTVGGRSSVYVKPQFPDAGYRVVNWGQAVKSGNDFTVDASVEKFTGASVQSVVTTAQIYDLGPLATGSYNFNFKTSGTLAKTLQFTVSSTVPPPNTIDDARQFVKQQYRDFLNREADQAGEDFWTDNITKCNDPARRPAGQTVEQCTLRQRETTSGAFFLSPEFQYTGYYVYRMYQGALGRQPKLSEFVADAQFVGNGIIVNGQLSAAKINQNKAAFAALFVNCTDASKYRCAEFKAIYDGLNNTQFVDKLFQTTGVNASATDRIDLVNSIGANQTRGSIVQKVVDGINVISEGNQQFTTSYGQAFYNSEFNRAFVQLEYFGYMKRDPDDAGYAFWLGKLNQFGGNFVNAEMVLGFISSPEYRARFGQP